MSLTLALGPVSSALANAKSATLAHVTPAPAHVAPPVALRPPAKNAPVAHTAGHKIA
jgi:hypothetical protein